MTTLDTVINDIEASANSFNNVIDKIFAIQEACFDEYERYSKENELEYMIEKDSDEKNIQDKMNEGTLKERLKVTIAKIKNAVIKFFKTIKSNILKIFGKKSYEEIVKELREVAVNNKKVKNTTIKVPDLVAVNKDIDKDLAKCRKILAKYKIGKFSEEDKKELEETKKKIYKRDIKIVAVTILGAITICEVLNKKNNTAPPVADYDYELPEWFDPEGVKEIINAEDIIAKLQMEQIKNNSMSAKLLRSVKDTVDTLVKDKRELDPDDLIRVMDKRVYENVTTDAFGVKNTHEFDTGHYFEYGEGDTLLDMYLNNTPPETDNYIQLYNEKAINGEYVINKMCNELF